MLKSFLNKIIKEDGFLLETSDKKTYTIGNPVKEKPVKLKLHNKSIEYKLALFSDYYFGKGFVDGEITIEQGDLSEILDIALKNIGRKDISEFSKIINKIRGTWRYLTNFNTRRSSRAAVEYHYDIGGAVLSMHLRMRQFLNDRHYIIYKMLFIDHIEEETVAKVLGYKSNEKGRKAGYKQIKNLKNFYKRIAKKICNETDIFFE